METTTITQPLLTAKEVCSFLRIPLSTLYGLTKKGIIPGTKVGKHWRYLASDIYGLLSGPETQIKEVA